MPGFRLVQGYTEARLKRGLDPQEVDRTLRTLIELNLVVRC